MNGTTRMLMVLGLALTTVGGRAAWAQEPAGPPERAPFPNYSRALLDMLPSLLDPKVGSQWLRTPGQSDSSISVRDTRALNDKSTQPQASPA